MGNPRVWKPPGLASLNVCHIFCLCSQRSERGNRSRSEKLEKAGTVDFKKHPARKVGKRSRQCGPKVPGRFAFPGARNPRICSIWRFGKNFPAIFPELSSSRGYPGQKLRSGQSKSWKNKHLGADIHDRKARTSRTLRDFQKLRCQKNFGLNFRSPYVCHIFCLCSQRSYRGNRSRGNSPEKF